MKRLSENIRNRYFDGLKEYITHRSEEHLTHAYEMGRIAVQKGVSELDLITYHHERLVELYQLGIDLDYQEKIQRASNYLKECLAPFEVKLGSYRNVIEELKEKNERLNEEISNRKEIEKELFRSKEYFQSLIENAQDIITVMDHNAIIRYSSPPIERILGYKSSELVGREAFQYVHENDVARVKKVFAEVISLPGGIRTAEFRFRGKDDDWVYLESIAKNVHDSPDGPIVIVNSRDVTERNRTIKKLQEHQFQLAEAQQIAKVGSWQWRADGDGGEVEWSDEMCRIFDIKPSEFDNKYSTYIKYIHPDDVHRFEKTVENALEEKNSFSIEHRVVLDDGTKRTLLCRGHVITDEDGEFIKMIGTGQDVTEQKKKEQRLREYSERLRNLSEKVERAREEERIRIARQVHDELGQMLTVLKMDVSMIRGELKKKVSEDILVHFNPQAAKILDRINMIMKSVQRITTELRPEVLDDLGLKEAIDWQANEYSKRTGVKVNFESNIDQTDFLDENRSTTLFRIFQETLTNITRHAEATKINIELKRQDDDLFLIVRDNGIGITEEQKEDSASLGIISMRERTKYVGGDVEIEGKKGKGTTIRLRIPLNGTV